MSRAPEDIEGPSPPSIIPGSVSSSGPATPSGEKDAEYDEPIHFVPKKAMASFENLVALANYQEGTCQL